MRIFINLACYGHKFIKTIGYLRITQIIPLMRRIYYNHHLFFYKYYQGKTCITFVNDMSIFDVI